MTKLFVILTTVNYYILVNRSEVWHCMSGIMEGGVKYVKSPGDIYRYTK